MEKLLTSEQESLHCKVARFLDILVWTILSPLLLPKVIVSSPISIFVVDFVKQ